MDGELKSDTDSHFWSDNADELNFQCQGQESIGRMIIIWSDSDIEEDTEAGNMFE